MFDKYELRGSIWKSKVNSIVGMLFLGSVALWAILFVTNITWGTDAISDGLVKVVEARSKLQD